MAKNEFSIKIPDREMKKALKDINNYEAGVLKAAKGLVRRTTRRVANRAMQNAPVRFGFLRQHIQPMSKDLDGTVTVEVDYGEAVEKGTKPHKIRPRLKLTAASRISLTPSSCSAAGSASKFATPEAPKNRTVQPINPVKM